MYCSYSTIYCQKKPNKDRNDNYQLHSFSAQKFSRKFINNLFRNFSNKHGNGLYSYAVFLSHAITSSKYNTSSMYRRNAYACFREKELMAFLDCKSKKALTKELERFGESGFCCAQNYSDRYRIFISGRISDELDEEPFTDAMVRSEFATVKGGEGYFFMDKSEEDMLLKAASEPRFSECDAILDLLMHTIYNDPCFYLSEDCPIVMYDIENFNYHTTVRFLANRWGMSVGKVSQFLKKLNDMNLFHVFVTPNHGIYITAPVYAESIWGISQVTESLYGFYRDAYGVRADRFYDNYVIKQNQKLLKSVRKNKEIRSQMWLCYVLSCIGRVGHLNLRSFFDTKIRFVNRAIRPYFSGERQCFFLFDLDIYNLVWTAGKRACKLYYIII